ncbi:MULTISPECIES: SMI1/KNR4 family protein [Methylomonas]|uniref:Knr4/Smi1-like domain-containing protein n=2 Tax=Methylomonas TaxID=416 RepID=A0A126T1W0_9GAMM|nr:MULTISPECIES: SMI1/KNR4 family protein [Methylomonas]AMK76072.1 hypothetical protein JT25_006120 [Methylomonas denitrificans]OAH99800.1 hypothetical protein A1342_16655 [Methylomonas methanica]TCV83907.1 hypothetical protein EDE11_10837 [Methylomonas methanica]
MKLNDLEKAVREHAGEFLCERINDEDKTKTVSFTHVVDAPEDSNDLPTVGRLRDFYETFGGILFYYDKKSGDAAKRIAPSSEWAELHADFSDWLEPLDEDERLEILPDWIDTCLVIGETPRSGNYILVATEGPTAGRVFEFDHDGYEFTDEAADIVEYVEKLLKPDGIKLVDIASHMRFIEGDPMVQWWIRELRDNAGHVASTQA